MKPAETSRISLRRQAALAEGGADYSAKRADLIRTAALVFREKGYTSATLNDVAARFGTDRASLYYYVGSKEELFHECIKDVLDENAAAAREIVASPDTPRQKLNRLVRVVLDSYAAHYPYMYLYIQEDMSHIGAEDAQWAIDMAEATKRFERVFLDLVTQGIEEGAFRHDLPPSLVTNALFGMLNWTHRWYVPERKFDSGQLAHTFLAIFYDGIDGSEV